MRSRSLATTPEQYDVVFDDGSVTVGAMLYRGEGSSRDPDTASIPVSWAQQDATQQLIRRDVPQVQADWAGGAGYSKPVPGISNGYAYAASSDTSVGGPGVWCRSPRIASPAGAVTSVTLPGSVTQECKVLFRFDGDLYALCGRYAVVLSGGTGTPTIAQDLGASFVANSAVEFNGDMYIGGTGGNIWKLTGSGGTWSQSADVARSYLVTVYWVVDGVGYYELVGRSAVGSMAYCSGNPMLDANWSADIAIGSSGIDITQIVAGPRHAYFLKPDGIFDVDARGYSPNLTPYWARLYNQYSGIVGMVHNGYAYAAHADFLDRVPITNPVEGDEEPEQCTPGDGLPNETPIHGRITAMCPGVGGWINAWVYNSHTDTSYLAAGKDRVLANQAGPGPLVWHYSEWDRLGRVTATLVDTPASTERPRLWAAAIDGTTISLQWQSQPENGDPYAEYLNGGSHAFGSSGVLVMTDSDWDDDAATKILKLHDIRTENLGAGKYITLYARAEDGDWASQGIAQVSPRSSFSATTTVSGYAIGRKLVFAGLATDPPFVRSVKTRASVVPDLFKSLSLTLLVGNGVHLAQGGVDTRDPLVVLNQIERMQAAGALTFTDWFGTSYDAEIEAGIDEVWRETSERGWMLLLRLSVTLRSSAFGQPLIYGVGQWGAGYVYAAAS